ncbi:MAG TPA: hypothetical protein VHQ64_13770 [Pyrinomonadaceae bacterium]|jgi:hypothetical protein|nr:hypothetical protein [Pyrinomonadaceae bacterium]
MKKRIIFALLLLIPCSGVMAQKQDESAKPKCALGLDQSPELRGFRMGLTHAGVLAKLPGVTIEKPDKFGLSRLRLSIIDPVSLIKTAPTRGKAVQPDGMASPTEGSAFVLDSARFPNLRGTRKIQMRFIDGRLSYLQVVYNDDVKFASVDQLIETISAKLKLPGEWQTPENSNSDHRKEFRCEGFVLTADVLGDPNDLEAGPELIVQDVAAWNVMSRRQNEITEKAKQEEDQKRKAFKP